MKVICVYNDNGRHFIKIGKEYDAEDIASPDFYFFKIKGSRYMATYPKSCFITIEEYRNRKLEEIGI